MTNSGFVQPWPNKSIHHPPYHKAPASETQRCGPENKLGRSRTRTAANFTKSLVKAQKIREAVRAQSDLKASDGGYEYVFSTTFTAWAPAAGERAAGTAGK